MAELKCDAELIQIARDAFLNESGAALIKKYASLNDELFTEAGFKEYAEDLLDRIVNPYLDDSIERTARDPQRKLSANDRIFGTMQLALDQDIEPVNMAIGAAAGINFLANTDGKSTEREGLKSVLEDILNQSESEFRSVIIKLTENRMDF